MTFFTSIHLRFVNLLSEANLDPVSLWRHVKAVRSEYRKRNLRDCTETALHSAVEDHFILDEEIEDNYVSLSKQLKVSNVSEEIKNVSLDIINAGGQMFLYLNSCPSIHWQNFYQHILYEKPTSAIILTVLDAMKNSNTRGSKLLANKVLGRLADILGFEYNQFENKREWTKSTAKVKGETTK